MENKKQWKLGRDSFSKLLLYFKDGNARTFYSLDWRHRYSKERNKELGLQRLRKIIEKHKAKIKTALIYDVQSGSEVVKHGEAPKEE